MIITGGSLEACASVPCKVLVGFRNTEGELALTTKIDDGRAGAGSTVTFAGATQPLDNAKFPLALDQLGATELATNRVKLGSMRVTLEGHEPLDVELKPLYFPVSALFARPEKVSFVDDSDSPERTSYFIAGARSMMPARVIGPGTLARDVDFLISEQRVQSGEKKCDGYRSSRGGPATSVLAFAYDSTMKVVNRRTGEVVKEEVLKAGPPVCPNLTIGFAGGVTDVPDRTITAWVEKAAR